MKTIDQVNLTPSQQDALKEIQRRLTGSFGIQAIHLFGSVARGEADEESDIDLLFITERVLQRPTRHLITDMITDVNLEYDTNFSSLVVDNDSWEQGVFTVLPLKEEILRDGVTL